MSRLKKTIKLSEFVRLIRMMQEIEPGKVQSFINRYRFTDSYAHLKDSEQPKGGSTS